MITILHGRLVEDCLHCDGGIVEVVPDSSRPWHIERRPCDKCDGSGYVLVLCAYCGEPAACVDNGTPKCREAFEEDHPGRKLPGDAETRKAVA